MKESLVHERIFCLGGKKGLGSLTETHLPCHLFLRSPKNQQNCPHSISLGSDYIPSQECLYLIRLPSSHCCRDVVSLQSVSY